MRKFCRWTNKPYPETRRPCSAWRDDIRDGASLLSYCRVNLIWHATSPHPTALPTALLRTPGKKLGHFPQVSGRCPLSARLGVIRSNESEMFKAGRLRRNKENWRQRQSRRTPLWFIFKDALLIASLIILLHARGRLDSWLPDLLNSHPIESSHSGGRNGPFFSRLHLLLSPFLFLITPHFHPCEGHRRGRLPRNGGGARMLTWSAKCFRRQGMWQSPPLVLQSCAAALSHRRWLTDSQSRPFLWFNETILSSRFQMKAYITWLGVTQDCVRHWDHAFYRRRGSKWWMIRQRERKYL